MCSDLGWLWVTETTQSETIVLANLLFKEEITGTIEKQEVKLLLFANNIVNWKTQENKLKNKCTQ